MTYYAEHKEEIRRKKKEYYKNHREEMRRKRKENYKKNREWSEKNKNERNKKERDFYKNGKIFYGHNPYTLARMYYDRINPELKKFSPTIANSNMSLETYIAMRAIFNPSTIMSLMKQLYYGMIKVEEIENLIKLSGFDMESEKFKYLIKCICSCKSIHSFYKNYNGGEFK